MTPEEIKSLDAMGSVTRLNAIQVGVLLIFYGIYTGVFPISVFLILTNTPRKATYILLCLTTVIFISTSVHTFSAYTTYMIFQVENFYKAVDIDLLARRKASAKQHKMFTLIVAYTWTQPINFIITDGIIVWRAFALWRNKWIRALLLTLMTSSAVMSLIYAGVSTKHHFSWLSNPEIDRHLVVSSIMLSFGVNLVATIFIGLKAWQHRSTAALFSSSTNSRRVLNIMIVLVETGAGLCVLQILYAVVFLSTHTELSTFNTARVCIQEGVIVLAAIYPTLLAMITLQQRFWVLDSAVSRSSATHTAAGDSTARSYPMQKIEFTPNLTVVENSGSYFDTFKSGGNMNEVKSQV